MRTEIPKLNARLAVCTWRQQNGCDWQLRSLIHHRIEARKVTCYVTTFWANNQGQCYRRISKNWLWTWFQWKMRSKFSWKKLEDRGARPRKQYNMYYAWNQYSVYSYWILEQYLHLTYTFIQAYNPLKGLFCPFINKSFLGMELSKWCK